MISMKDQSIYNSNNKIQMPSFYHKGKEIGNEDNYMEIKNLVEI